MSWHSGIRKKLGIDEPPRPLRIGRYRTVILYRQESRAFFVFGFAKSQQSNISDEEKVAFKQVAQHILSLSDEHLDAMIEKGQFSEVDDNG
ncbi:MAG: type II toxin-antitoxin system RelE/ParE family toxin [Halomonas sp.]|uniref:type II toxin-antitoxin system RelE/ParE family toxin n=1 Tax=Halomonas sp. TaxID=1486246 RepID=UPI001A005351|nr:type II toxin-antitoxin system RelE/ParE family toxin [Halomonas sp.]MBE0490437.1 type II toxin-antitoxin system RelE/ParE family toxin [Halomonas sp.]